MARAQIKLEFSEAAFQETDKFLAQLDHDVRGNAIAGGMRAVGNDIVKQTKAIVPKPGYPGDKPGLTPLRDTPKTKIKSYQDGQIKVAVIGYAWPEGAHGHLLEHGHDIVKGGKKKDGGIVVGHVQAYPYMVNVVKTTQARQNQRLVDFLRRKLDRQNKGRRN